MRIKLATILFIAWPAILLAADLSTEQLIKLSPDLQLLVNQQNSIQVLQADMPGTRVLAVRGTQAEILYPVTLRCSDVAAVNAIGIQTNSDHAGWSTARVNYAQLLQLAELQAVDHVFQGEPLQVLNDIAVGESGADLVHEGYLNNTAYDGSGVIVLVIDTGIDWSHLDFRDPGDDTQSRILYIWDQTLTKTGSEGTPEDRDGTHFAGLNYGVEYTQAQIEDEIDGSAAGFVRETDSNGHGTAVAGAAAGNGAALSNTKYKGMAPGADLVIVKAGDNTLSDNNVKDALTYAQQISATTGKALVANLSLGNQSNAHDGTSTLDEAVDDFVASGNGRIAVVAAGNNGNDPIHVTGTVAAAATGTITISVPSFSNTNGVSNDYFSFELWWNNNADVTAQVTSPTSKTYTRTADQTGTSLTTDGAIQLNNITDSDHSNGDRRTFFKVYDATDGVGPAVGDWTLAVTNNSAATMTYHAWLYASSMEATVSGGDSTYTIASPGTAAAAITVGAYTARWRWHATDGNSYAFSGTDRSDDLAYFSSIGPTRDGNQKPDLCAPGRGLISSTSSASSPAVQKTIETGKYHLTEGTSGAAAVVSGAVALMLDEDASLTASSAKPLLRNYADNDSYTGTVPSDLWGYGKLNIFESLARSINNSATVDHDIYCYDGWGGGGSATRSAGYKDAVRFSPSKSGDVTGVFFHVGSTVPASGSLSFEVWSNSGNLPNTKLGSTVTLSAADIAKYSWNYVGLKGAGVSVTAGTDYHLVIDNTSGADYTLYAETSSIDQRSSRNLGSGWGGPYTTLDWRIRPVVSTDETTLDSSLPVELAYFNAATEKGQLVLSWATESEFENLGFKLERRAEKTADWQLVADYVTSPALKGQGSSTSRTNYHFVDQQAKVGIIYDYRLSDISYSAIAKTAAIILEDVQLLPGDFELYANYPNPFNPSTRIAYELAGPAKVQIRITDIQGQEIRLWNYQSQFAGYHETFWDGLNHAGHLVSAGIYFTTVQAGAEIHSQKMLLIK